ncbi:hypothetical protein [Bacillus sp. 03113]|uniref:hypothetical protein n=1 Tax=Bacillus sp. 03113 TaxID=2578211 RepID=UPI001143E29D|nr:hypothetical protein [Bacillus sp. 03113]
MDTIPLFLIDNKHKKQLKINRMAVYLQGKIVEVIDDTQQIYYLFFYKNHYLTGVKAAKWKKQSVIDQAFSKGIVFHENHPLTTSLLSSYLSFKISPFHHLMNNLKKQYTPQEIALIATYFESFIPDSDLFTQIQSIFYQYRRNGQMLASYRILQILKDFIPGKQWAIEIANKLEFTSSRQLYTAMTKELMVKDAIYAEKMLALHKDIEENFLKLHTLLINENRWIDLISLYIEKFISTPTKAYFDSLMKILEMNLNEDQIINVLESLLEKQFHLQEWNTLLIDKYLNTNNLEKALKLLTSQQIRLSPHQANQFEIMLEQLNIEDQAVNIEKLNTILPSLYKSNLLQVEKFLQKCVKALFKNHDLHYVQSWLEPFNRTHPNLPLLKKINKMSEISGDPDQQYLLGELYYQFGLLESAIDCFSWEMELNEANPKPIQWLAKIYREMGKELEAKAYQLHYLSIQKQAN